MTSTGFPAFLSFSGAINPLCLNQWNHVVGMVDNAGKTLNLAVNGELSGTLALGGTVDFSFPQTFSVGNSYPRSLGDFPFLGRIDEIRISSTLRYGGNFTPPSLLDPDGGTVGLWHFDEAAGATSFADSSGNGNTLTGLDGAATREGTREVQAGENSPFYAFVATLTLGQLPGPIAIGDFNHDGENDLATIAGIFAIAGDTVAVFLGTGEGSFAPPSYFSTGERGPRSSIALGDFNKDGNLDIAVPSSGVTLLLGTGNGSFGNPAIFPARANPSSLSAGDFNDDGNLDLVTANWNINSVSILPGAGTGTFGSPVDFAVGSLPTSLVAGDFNGDEKLDLAVANSDSASVTILLGTGTGSFEAPSTLAVGYRPFSLTTDDFNGDGNLDLAVARGTGLGFDDAVSILMGTGTGAFALPSSFPVPHNGRMAIGDINQDGKLDLVVASTLERYPEFYILPGDDTGSFGSPVTYYTDGEPISLAIGDLSGDGKADLALGVFSSPSKVQVFIAR